MNYQGNKTTREARTDGSPVIMNVSGKKVNYKTRLRITIARWPGGVYNPREAKYLEDFYTNYRTIQELTNELDNYNDLYKYPATGSLSNLYSKLIRIIQARKVQYLYL
jgi:hypothetical protein